MRKLGERGALMFGGAATVAVLSMLLLLGPLAPRAQATPPAAESLAIRQAVGDAFLAMNVTLPVPGHHLMTASFTQSGLASQPDIVGQVFTPGSAVYQHVLGVRRKELGALAHTWRMTSDQLESVTLTGLTVTGSTAVAKWTITAYSVVYILPYPYKPGTWVRNPQTTTMTGQAQLSKVGNAWVVDSYSATFGPGSGP